MIGKVIHTFGSRLFIAGISFLILSLNANYLGAEGLGTIGLIVLGITVIQLFANLINGGIIYFFSRIASSNLLLMSYTWSILSVIIFAMINHIIELFDAEFSIHIYLLGLLQSFISIHFYLLIGAERIKFYNYLNFFQSFFTVLFLSVFFFIQNNFTVTAFIYSLYISYILVWFSALLRSRMYIKAIEVSVFWKNFKEVLSYGFFIQAANTFQLLNYRISYFILDFYSGRAALGQFTAGIQLSEALLIPGRSIATVQYARISKKRNLKYAQKVSLLFLKLSLAICIVGLIILLFIPLEIYQFLLGSDFLEIKNIMAYLSIGLLALSAEIIISHYFSGTGRQKINSISALIGLGVTLISCFVLIPKYGIIGAAIASSLSYFSMFVFLYIKMNKEREVNKISFFLNRKDIILLKRIIIKRV